MALNDTRKERRGRRTKGGDRKFLLTTQEPMIIEIPSLWFTNFVFARGTFQSMLNKFIVITMTKGDGVDLVMRKSYRGCKQTPMFPTCEEEIAVFGLFPRCAHSFFSYHHPYSNIYIIYQHGLIVNLSEHSTELCVERCQDLIVYIAFHSSCFSCRST